MSVRLHFNGGTVVDVTRPDPRSSWRADVACPVCGLTPIRVRAYDDDPPAPRLAGHATALAWCAGRHREPVGFVSEPFAPGLLLPMGVPTEQPETFRCRIYGEGA